MHCPRCGVRMLRESTISWWCLAHQSVDVEVYRHEQQLTMWRNVKKDARLPDPEPWPDEMKSDWRMWKDSDDWKWDAIGS